MIPRLRGHGDSTATAPSPNWVLTPVYNSDIVAGPFAGSPPAQSSPWNYGIDAWDCTGSVAAWATAYPNEFNVQFVQGVWQDDMWPTATGAKEPVFANRVVQMMGTHSASVMNLLSGAGDTMPTDNAKFQKYQHGKFAIGTTNQGVLLKGGRYEAVGSSPVHVHRDLFQATGTASYAWAAFDSATDEGFLASSPSTGAKSSPLFAILHASENHSFVGKRISESNSSGALTSGVDARALTYRESDKFAPGVAMIHNSTGSVNGVWLDLKKDDALGSIVNKHGGPGNAPGGRGQDAGYIHDAIGTMSLLAAPISGSYVNVGLGVGFLGVFTWGDPPSFERIGDLEGCDASDRCDSVIRELVFFKNLNMPESESQADPPGCEQLISVNSIGLFLSDTIPGSGGGAETQHAGLISDRYFEHTPDKFVATPERRAGIINRGDTVLGDGRVGKDHGHSTGFDTDVVHVRDVLHLNPRTAPPVIASSVPASDRAGLLYFDAGRGTLRVSVPIRGPETTHTTDWKHDAVAWVDVPLATDRIRPEDIVLNDPETFRPEAYFDAENHPETGGAEFRALIDGGLERARAEAQGDQITSPYIAPALEVIARDRVADDTLVLHLQLAGFRRLLTADAGDAVPEVHFSIRTQRTKTYFERSNWSLVPAANVLRTSARAAGVSHHPGDEVLSVAIPLPAEHRAGTLHVTLIDPETGQTAGTSCVIPLADAGAKVLMK
jgi:hypothetical protein